MVDRLLGWTTVVGFGAGIGAAAAGADLIAFVALLGAVMSSVMTLMRGAR